MKKSEIISLSMLIVIGVLVVALIISHFLFSIYAIIFLGGGFNKPDYEDMQKIFVRDEVQIKQIANFLAESDEEGIIIHDSTEKGMMFVYHEHGDVKIENSEIINAIEVLKNNGCRGIYKSGNTIEFQVWATKDAGRGIAYTVDGATPEIEFLTDIRELPNETSWFYYEDNYKKWRQMMD